MKKLSIVLLLVSASCLSCETVVDLDVETEEPRLVLNSFFNPDSSLKVVMYESSSILDDFEQPKGISGAEVMLFDANDDYLLQFDDNGDGSYTADYKPEAGKGYKIQAKKNGYETVQAEDSIPLDSAIVTNVELIRLQDEYVDYSNEIRFKLKDTRGEDFYEVSVLVNVEMFAEDTLFYQDSGYYYLNSDDPVFSENMQNGYNLVFNDKLFNGKEREIAVTTFLSYSYCSGECTMNVEAFLIVKKVSKAFYLYRETFALQLSLEGDPFAEPVSVFNNIQNGYGIFAGYRTSVYPLNLEELRPSF